jgi:hypothetical protein
MLETLIVVLVVLWLLGYIGGRRRARVRSGNLVHLLLVIALILLILRLLR